MVFSTILAYFLNYVLISVYFSLKICIHHPLNICKIIPSSILLSCVQAFISRIIFEGMRSLNPPSTPSRLDFTLLRPPPSLHHHPRSRPLHLKFACRLGHEPLPSVEGCGLHPHRFGSLTSEDAIPAAPPLSKGMWAT